MNLRWQILLGSVALAVLPLVLVIMTIRSEVTDRFTELDTARVDHQISIVRDDLTRQSHQLATLLDKLGMTAAQLVRRGEEAYKAGGLDQGSSDDQVIAAMADNPKLIERPIVVRGDRAVLGRPPENVLELIG